MRGGARGRHRWPGAVRAAGSTSSPERRSTRRDARRARNPARGGTRRVHLSPARGTGLPRLGADGLPRDRLGGARSPDPQRELSGCRASVQRPLVLLDGSLSIGRAGRALGGRRGTRPSRWARSDSSVTSGAAATRCPTGAARCSGPALTAAAASDRPVIVVTDGEVEDAARPRRPSCSAARACRVFPRDTQPDSRRSPRSTGPVASHGGRLDRARGRGAALGGAASASHAARGPLRREARSGSQTVRMDRDGRSARDRVVPSPRSVPGTTCFAMQARGTRTPSRAPTPGSIWSPWRRRPVSSSWRRRPIGTADFSTARCATSLSFPCAGSSGSTATAGAR